MNNWINPHTEAFFDQARSGIKMKLFLLYKLPMAWLAGCRVEHLDARKCTISVPFKWLNQNPFQSTYFAVLSMAGEMSQGLIAYGTVYKADPQIAMIVTAVQADFIKKAKGRIFFTCDNGDLLLDTVRRAIGSAEGAKQWVESIGRNEEGEEVARFRVEWSFKAKQAQ